MRSTKLTKSSTIYNSIKEDILNGTLPAGKKISMEMLKDRYQVAFSPCREALARLQNQKLVHYKEQCGYYVPELSLAELYDLYKIRVYLEAYAIELAIQQGDEIWEAEVNATWLEYKAYLSSEKAKTLHPIEWELMQKQFRFSLVKACKSPWLLHLRESTYEQAARYRALCLTTHRANQQLRLECLKENNRLVKAVLARDAEKAIHYTKKSWELSVKSIADILINMTTGR